MTIETAATIPAIPRSPESAPTTFMIPGGSSDLVKSLVLPELDKLVRIGRCSNTQFLFINQEGQGDTEEQRSKLDAELKKQHGYKDQETRQLMQKIFAVECPDLTDENGLKELFSEHRLNSVIRNIMHTRWLMHTALPPAIWSRMLCQMPDLNNLERVLLEKPVGTNETEAQTLIDNINKTPHAPKTRAIDHYLGKTIVDYLVKLKQGRNTDSEIAKAWADRLGILLDPKHWEKVMVIMDEEKGLSERGQFFESVGGIVPDMLQSHMLFTLASIEAITEEKDNDEQIARYLDTLEQQQILGLAQYRGYKNHLGVDPDSETPTGIKGRFEWNQEDRNIPHEFRIAKGVAQKRGRIEIVYSNPIFSEKDESYIDGIQIRLHRRTLILLKRDKNGASQREEINIIPDSVADLGAYGNLYSDAIAGENTGTVALDNVLRSHQVASPFLQTDGLKRDAHPQGQVWGNF